MLITGDRDYAYAVSTLKLRKYQVVLVVPSPQASLCLQSQASVVIDWGAAVLRTRTEAGSSVQAVRQPCPDLDANLVAKLLKVLQEPPLDDDSDTTSHSYFTAFQGTPSLRRTGARDLLETSGPSKNTGSVDSTEGNTHTPASSRKSTSAGSDPTSLGPPNPKTPPRSRHASVSTGSSRAIVAQSPPAVEQDIPARSPPPSSARRPCPSDITDVFSPAKRAPSVLPSLDALESPFRESGPPSSIIIRSPLGPGQSTGDMPASGNPGIPFFHKFNGLGSPFVMPKVPTGLESIPNPSTKQPHTAAKPTPLTATPTKTVTETVTGVCQTPQIKDIGVPKEIERLTGPRIEGDDANREWSIPHRVHSKEGASDTTYTANSKNHSYVAPHTIYSPLSRNVGLHLVDTPSSEHVSPPAAIPLGVGDGVDSAPFASFSRASGTLERSTTPGSGSESELSCSSFPSTPFTTSRSHEYDESERRQTWKLFKPLIHLLLAARESGITHPLRSTIALDLVQSDSQVYERAGVSKFRNYTALAEKAGIIELGGKDGDWITLHPNWFGVADSTTTHSLSNKVPSPTPDPPKAIQSPLSTGSGSPQIERTTLSQPPTFTSPKPNSPESSKTLPTLPSDRQDGASRASIPPQFQPLIDILIRMRADGPYPTLKSAVGGLLGKDVYARAGVLRFKEYVLLASEAHLVQVGGDASVGQEWIRLHPELRI
jgi:hypothetical protein